jgi:hypothetical protein
MLRHLHRLAAAAMTLGVHAAAASGAPAAGGEGVAPPMPTLSAGKPVWLGFAVMFVLVAIVVAVSIMPSKRSHQD